MSEEEIETMSVRELKAFILGRGGSVAGLLEKSDLRQAARSLL